MVLADQLHTTSRVSTEAWLQASALFSAEQLIELVMLAGSYRTVSYFVNAFGVEHEPWAPRFPRVANPAGR